MSTPLFQQLPEGSRILFIRLRNLGEAVLDTANLRALKRFRPDLQITSMVEAIYTDLYQDDPDIAPMGLPRSPQSRRSSWLARLKVIDEIRRQKFDAVINLHGGSTSATLTMLSGAKRRVGASHYRGGPLAYTTRIPPVSQLTGRNDLHTVESQFEQFRWLGLEAEEAPPTHLNVVPRFRASAHGRLRDVGIDPARPYVVLAPTNDFFTKLWAPEKFAAVADLLLLRGYQIVLTGAPTPSQRAQLSAVQAATRHCLPILSTLTIGELVAVIADAALFVGNDSGPGHIAAAVKTPLAVTFGPGDSVRWRPWRSPSVFVQNYFPCNPCDQYSCKAFELPECIRSITVEQMIKAIEQLMAKEQLPIELPREHDALPGLRAAS